MSFKKEYLIFLLACFLILLYSFLSKGSSYTLTINLNTTQVWWNDSIYCNGIVEDESGNPVEGNVTIEFGDYLFDCPPSTSLGEWNCTVRAPLELGMYSLIVNITNSTGYSFINSTLVEVKPFYGKLPLGIKEKFSLEIPYLIQEVSGRIRKVVLRLIVWKE